MSEDLPKFLESHEPSLRKESEKNQVEAQEEVSYEEEIAEFEEASTAVSENDFPSRQRRRIPWLLLVIPACGIFAFVMLRAFSGVQTVQPTDDSFEIAAAQTGTALALAPTSTATLKPSETANVKAVDALFVFNPISRLDGAKLVFGALEVEEALPVSRGYFDDEELSQEDAQVLEEMLRQGLYPTILQRNPNDEHQFDPEELLFRKETAVWKLLLVHGGGWEPNLEECLEIFQDVSCDHPFRPWIEALWLEGYYLIGERPDLFDPNGEVDATQLEKLLQVKGGG